MCQSWGMRNLAPMTKYIFLEKFPLIFWNQMTHEVLLNLLLDNFFKQKKLCIFWTPAAAEAAVTRSFSHCHQLLVFFLFVHLFIFADRRRKALLRHNLTATTTADYKRLRAGLISYALYSMPASTFVLLLLLFSHIYIYIIIFSFTRLNFWIFASHKHTHEDSSKF